MPEGNTSPEQKNPSRHSILPGNAEKMNLLTHTHALKMFVTKVMIEIVYGYFSGFFEEVLYLQ